MQNIVDLTYPRFIELYVRQNLTLQEIGDIYEVSRQRIHQIKNNLERKYGKILRKKTIDSFTLKEMLDKGCSMQEIAVSCHTSISKINRLIRKYEEEYKSGVSPVRIVRKKSKDVLPKPLLYQLYTNELKNDKEIGDMYGLSQTAVWLLRKEYQIESFYSKNLRRLPQLLSKEKFIQLHVKEKRTLQDLADTYECNLVSILKLKQHYGIKK